MSASLSLQPTTPPAPVDPEEAARWAHTRLRRRLLQGRWDEDLRRRLYDHFGDVRTEALGPPDMSSNALRTITAELAVLYDSSPEVFNDDGGAELAALVARSGLWAMMPRYQQFTLGLREMLIRPDYTDRAGLSYRVVYPDMVVAWAHPDLPDLPVGIQELRLRSYEGKPLWTWDHVDVSDLENPVYRVEEARGDHGQPMDLTTHFLGGPMSGEDYPYRRLDGRPVLPYVMHHARRTGDGVLFDAWEGLEVVDGTLTAAVLWSWWVHCVRDASWPQRTAANVTIPGSAIEDTDTARRRTVPTDPASILLFESLVEGTQPMFYQYQAGCDPKALYNSIAEYEFRVATLAGVSPDHLVRNHGTPRSGYALSVSNAGKREAQRRYEPMAQDGDGRLLALSAVIVNSATGSRHPEDRWVLRYTRIPESPEELEARRTHVLELLDRGLMSPIKAYMSLTGIRSEKEARRELEKIRQERSTLSTLSLTA